MEDHMDLIIHLITEKDKTHSQVSEYLTQKMGITVGASTRSVRRFCTEHGITRRANLSKEEIIEVVSQATEELGPTYGRKMMKGYLAEKGIHVCEKLIREAMLSIKPSYHEERQQGARNLNPIPYHAAHFGDKIHIDQNEKLVMFGATHVMAIDGYSGKIVAHTTMATKNNLRIYDDIYKKAVLEYGLWEQVRVDHGKEFYLMLFAQEKLSGLRRRNLKQPYLQTASKRNHRIERMWPEVNNRVNYPLKEAIVQMVDNDMLSVDDNITRFAMSDLLIQLCEIGMGRLVTSWNAHTVSGRGVPNLLAADNQAMRIDPALLPPADEVAAIYERETGGRLNHFESYSTNPFQSEHASLACNHDFMVHFPNLGLVYNKAVNRDYSLLQQALHYHIQITNYHCHQI